jgi:hypothetical protein
MNNGFYFNFNKTLIFQSSHRPTIVAPRSPPTLRSVVVNPQDHHHQRAGGGQQQRPRIRVRTPSPAGEEDVDVLSDLEMGDGSPHHQHQVVREQEMMAAPPQQQQQATTKKVLLKSGVLLPKSVLVKPLQANFI